MPRLLERPLQPYDSSILHKILYLVKIWSQSPKKRKKMANILSYVPINTVVKLRVKKTNGTLTDLTLCDVVYMP